MAIPSGQLNTPLRAGSRQALPPLAASPARSRSPQIQCARILRPARTPTPPPPLMRPQRRAATCAPHATARSDAYPSAVARRLTHITLVILCRRRLALPCAMALGDGHMLGGEQAASCMEYGVVSASTMACHAARHTLCVASKPRRLSVTASPARITQNIFTNTRRVKHARRHAEARRAESSLGSLSVRT